MSVSDPVSGSSDPVQATGQVEGAGFGYQQELTRVLKQFSVFAVSFSIVSITTGIFLNYGIALNSFGPLGIWLWPVAILGQTVVAMILAELATRIPLAGANYQWASRLVGPRYGYVVGALGIMYSAVGMPGIILLVTAPLLGEVLGIDPSKGSILFFIAVILILIAFVINIISVQLAARVNNVAVVTEILGTVLVAVILFILWVVHAKPSPYSFGFLFSHTTTPGQSTFYAIILASVLGIYTISGFEAAADMGEEAIDARRTVPRAMIGSVVISGVLGMITLIGFTIAIPNLKAIQGTTNPPLAVIMTYWLGTPLTDVFLLIVVFSTFALTVVAAASSARLIFAMARDNMLPGSKTLMKVGGRHNTPVAALVVSLVICISFMTFGYLDGNAFGTLAGATALIPYVIYLLTVIAYGLRRRRLERLSGSFNLGRWAVPLFIIAVVWLVCAILAVSLPAAFHTAVYVTLGALALAAVWYVVGLHQRLKAGTAGPPLLSGAGQQQRQKVEES